MAENRPEVEAIDASGVPLPPPTGPSALSEMEKKHKEDEALAMKVKKEKGVEPPDDFLDTAKIATKEPNTSLSFV